MKMLWRARLKSLRLFIRECYDHFMAVDASSRAGSLAYTTLVSLVPLAVLSLSFVLAFPSLSQYFQLARSFVFRHLIPTSAESIEGYVDEFAKNAMHLSAAGVVFFAITSVLLIFSVETALNSVFKVKERRKGMRAFLMYWAFLTLMPPLGVMLVAISVYIMSLPLLPIFWEILGVILPIFISFAGYLFLFMALPNCDVRFKDAWVGAATSAILFEGTKMGFGYYVSRLSSDTVVYGILSAIPVTLLWLYLAWMITLVGAIIAYQHSKQGA